MATSARCTLPGLTALLAAAHACAATCTPQWSHSIAANTRHLQTAIDQCSAAGGGLVDLTVNNGISSATITTVHLGSNIVLKLEQGFTLQGASDVPAGSALLIGNSVHNVTITGTGIIDGNGAAYWASSVGKNNTPHPKLIKIKGSAIRIGSNFADDGTPRPLVRFPSPDNDAALTLKIRNAPKEQVVFESGSQDVTVDGVWIYANPDKNGEGKNLAPNTDAIDIIGTTTATIRNCVLDTGDDDIAIKSNAGGPATTGVVIDSCVIGGGHGISIGGQEAAGHTLSRPGVSGVSIRSILFKGTDYGFRIKTDQTAADSGATNGVSYSDTCMQDVGEPFLFTYTYAAGSGGSLPVIANVSIDNVLATATKTQGAIIGLATTPLGIPSSGDAGIRMRNTQISGGSAFSIRNGALLLGANSRVDTANRGNAQVIRIPDSGATITCPARIVIPKPL